MNYTIHIPASYADYLDKSIKKWTSHKRHVRKTLDYWDFIRENPLSPQTSARVHNCGSWLYFRNYEDIDKSTLKKANFCNKDKICPACASRRANKRVEKVLGQLSSNPSLIDGYWYYIVLPVRHTADESLGVVFERLQKGLKGISKALRNVRNGQGTENYFAQNFDGIMYSIEETKTENGWNVHANLLCRSDKPLRGLIKKPKSKNGKRKAFWHPDAVETWKYLTGSINVSISPIDVSNQKELFENLHEVFKYSLKFQDLSPDDMLIAYRTLFGRRLLGSMGTLRGLKSDVVLNGDDVENQIFIETMVTCHGSKLFYTIENHRRGKVYKNGYSIYEALDYLDYLDDMDSGGLLGGAPPVRR
jgi:hypothetical protein